MNFNMGPKIFRDIKLELNQNCIALFDLEIVCKFS